MKIRTTLAIAVLAMLVVPGAAQAHKKVYPASLAVTAIKGANAEGKIASNPPCIAGRSVSVLNSSGAVIDTGLSDATGTFKLKAKDPGSYSAVVKRRVLRRDKKHKHICGGAQTSFVVT